MTITKRNIIVTVIAVLFVLLLIFIPKAGKTALYESLIGMIGVFGLIIYYGVKLFKNRHRIKWNWAKDWYIVIFAVFMLSVGGIMAKDVVTDAISGPKTHIITEVHCVKEQRIKKYGFSTHYYLTGKDENGDKVRLEIDKKDAECLVINGDMTVTYYENIKKVYKIGK